MKQHRAWLLLGWVTADLASSPPARPLVFRKSPLSRWSPVVFEWTELLAKPLAKLLLPGADDEIGVLSNTDDNYPTSSLRGLNFRTTNKNGST
ncbi:hypothetical protein J6590_059519 [Homalodisca vitripennis]|nr:hypothetical protein J6590_059519 [Homalodisca vitripennis]